MVLMIAFTIVFGVRRLDPTEQHQGMVAAVALESVVKLIAFLAAGIFVSYFVFDGMADIFNQWSIFQLNTKTVVNTPQEESLASWITYLLLGMS